MLIMSFTLEHVCVQLDNKYPLTSTFYLFNVMHRRTFKSCRHGRVEYSVEAVLARGQIYKISYDLSYDYRKFIV